MKRRVTYVKETNTP